MNPVALTGQKSSLSTGGYDLTFVDARPPLGPSSLFCVMMS